MTSTTATSAFIHEKRPESYAKDADFELKSRETTHNNNHNNEIPNDTQKNSETLHEGEPFINDFVWTAQEEPHRSRRKAIIKAHPEVLKLCGPEPSTKYIISSVVLLQLLIAFTLRNESPFSLKVLLTAYIVGATANQNVFLAIHEISHNLAFKSRRMNKLFAALVNIPIGVPYAASFRPYHLLHHKFLGYDKIDTDIPTRLEAIVLSNLLGKAFFATFQIFFYAIRPMCVANIPITFWHLFNLLYVLFTDYLVVHFWGYTSLNYFLLSSFFAGSLHPCAGHFIAEHYVMDPQKYENENGKKKLPKEIAHLPPPDTYSYYGILNFFTYNVGYHNEHHDFPYIAWSKLPKLRELAPEYYDYLPSHSSWVYVLYQFILDSDINLWCRVKRTKDIPSKDLQVD